MRLFHGLSVTDYQDVLRALGLLLDERGYRDVRLIEHEEGMLLQALPTVDGQVSATYETLLLTDAVIQQLLTDAYARRASVPVAAPPPTGVGLVGLLPTGRLGAAHS